MRRSVECDLVSLLLGGVPQCVVLVLERTAVYSAYSSSDTILDQISS